VAAPIEEAEPAVAYQPPARLRVVAYPWAEIRVGESESFLTPRAAPLELEPGRHRIHFSHPRFGEHVYEVELAAGEERVLRHEFPEAPRP
jgi:hypothetical protein